MGQGLTARDWLTLSIFGLGLIVTVASFMLRRLLVSIDKHGTDIGVIRESLGQYVKRDTHDVASAETVALIERLRLEANQREERILRAIDTAGDRNTAENLATRSELGIVHGRIDRIRDQAGDRPRSRGG